MFYAYHPETGVQVKFHHAVDYRTALTAKGYLANPPGTPAAPVKGPEPVGEMAAGIEAIEEKVVVSAEEEKPKSKKDPVKLKRE